jgi:hypothetical protein
LYQNDAYPLSMKNKSISTPPELAHINGWAIDADPENEPTYPIKKYTGDDHRRLNYQRPIQQPVNVEILQSNERPAMTAVFGTSVPPKNFSGKIRRFAFKFSEGSWGHWLPLILADRVNVIEGIIDDMKQGHIPNIIAERGWNAEWKYNKPGLLKKVAIGLSIGIILYTVVRLSNKNKSEID